MSFETNSNNEIPTNGNGNTATTGKTKKSKKGGGSKKAGTANAETNGKSENAILSKQHSNETSKQSFDLMEAMMDDFCVTKHRGSERSSISHSFSVDDSTACDLAIELNPKKRVTRAGTKK